MAGHYRLSASGSHRWMNCPGQLRLCEGLTSPAKFYTAEGTVAHAIGEDALKHMDSKRPFKRVGETIESDGFNVLVTREMAEAVEVYAQTVLEEMDENKPAFLSVEKHFHLKGIHPQLGGTNDASILAEFDKLIVYDYKHGAGVPVDVEDNPQFLLYAIGALEGVDVENVEIVVVQPRCTFGDGAVRRWSTSASYIRNWIETELKPAIKRVEAADAKRKLDVNDLCPGEHCRFCPAKQNACCPAQENHTLSMAVREFDGVPHDPDTIVLPAPQELTPEQLSRAMKLVAIAKQWFKGVENLALQRATAGEVIPGFKLVETKGNRKWKSVEEALKVLKPVAKNVYEPQEIMSPSRLEKELKAEGMDKKRIADLLAPLVERKAGTTPAPESDKRPALPPGAVEVFTNVNEGDE